MILRLSHGLDGPEVTLVEAQDFSRFHVELDNLDEQAAVVAFRALDVGELANSAECAVSIQTVCALSRLGADRDWNEGLEKMLRYADSHGWLTADGTAIIAHICWLDAQDRIAGC
jgi:hypothetical protein